MNYLKKVASFVIALVFLNSSLWCMEDDTSILKDDATLVKFGEIETKRSSSSSFDPNNLLLFLKCAERCRNSCGVDLVLNVKWYIGNLLCSLVIKDALYCNFELSKTITIPSDLLVTLSFDGKTILTLPSELGTIACLRSAETEKLIAQLHHSGAVCLGVFSFDGGTVLTGSSDNTACLWSAKTGQLIRTFSHSGPVLSVALSPDGKTVLTGSFGEAYLWNAKMGECIKLLHHSGAVVLLAFSPDGKTVLTVSGDKNNETGYLWSAETGEKIRELEGHPYEGNFDRVVSVNFSPDGKVIFTELVGKTGCVLWSAETGKKIKVSPSDSKLLAFSPDGKTVLISGCHFTDLCTIGAKEPVVELRNCDNVLSAAFSLDSKIVFIGFPDKKARLCNAKTGELLRKLQDSKGLISVAFNSDRTTVFATSLDGKVCLWSLSCDAFAWISSKANLLQIGLIGKASQEKKDYGFFYIVENTFEHEIFLSMPKDVREYLIKWYSITIISKKNAGSI